MAQDVKLFCERNEIYFKTKMFKHLNKEKASANVGLSKMTGDLKESSSPDQGGVSGGLTPLIVWAISLPYRAQQISLAYRKARIRPTYTLPSIELTYAFPRISRPYGTKVIG